MSDAEVLARWLHAEWCRATRFNPEAFPWEGLLPNLRESYLDYASALLADPPAVLVTAVRKRETTP